MVTEFTNDRSAFRDVVALVVEDNEFLRGVVGTVLHQLGINDVRYVRTPEGGLRAFAKRAAHVVIVEFGDENEAACRLLKKLQLSQQETHAAPGLIALVPQPDRLRVIKAHDSGAEAVVAEPIAPGDLAAHVRTIVKRHFQPRGTRRRRTGYQPGATDARF